MRLIWSGKRRARSTLPSTLFLPRPRHTLRGAKSASEREVISHKINSTLCLRLGREGDGREQGKGRSGVVEEKEEEEEVESNSAHTQREPLLNLATSFCLLQRELPPLPCPAPPRLTSPVRGKGRPSEVIPEGHFSHLHSLYASMIPACLSPPIGVCLQSQENSCPSPTDEPSAEIYLSKPEGLYTKMCEAHCGISLMDFHRHL